MDSQRLKQALNKAFPITSGVFGASVVLLAGMCALFGELIYPVIIGRLFLTFTMLYFLTVTRMYVAGTRWACNKPYVLVNIMFAPLYFGFAVLGMFTGNEFIRPILTPDSITTWVGWFSFLICEVKMTTITLPA